MHARSPACEVSLLSLLTAVVTNGWHSIGTEVGGFGQATAKSELMHTVVLGNVEREGRLTGPR